MKRGRAHSNVSADSAARRCGRTGAFFRGGTGDPLSPREAMALLTDSERSRLVRFLLERSPRAVTIEEAADALAGGADSDGRKEARIALVHRHLPKLEDAGVATLGPGGRIEYHRDPTLESLVRFVDEHDP